jgi:hypothetical protein
MRPIRLLLAAVVVAGTLAQTAAASTHKLSFALRYEKVGTTLTKLEVINLTPQADLKVTLACPVGEHCPSGFTVAHVAGTVKLASLTGRKLPAGTKITVLARHGRLGARTTLTLR